jgi:hypothetical protein
MPEARLAEVEAHLAAVARKDRKEAVAHGIGGELEDDHFGGAKLPLRETCICILSRSHARPMTSREAPSTRAKAAAAKPYSGYWSTRSRISIS